ncbi:MAG: hybrid sensor histidine kinase/response regulator, partial [Desulfobulbus sp.]|nr:hybrid sensor histidine kinase/response regulator [Desulfobulbus sp.]
MPLTALFVDLVNHEADLIALCKHLEQEAGTLIFFCQDMAGRHIASAAFPLDKGEAARLITMSSQTSVATIRATDGRPC